MHLHPIGSNQIIVPAYFLVFCFKYLFLITAFQPTLFSPNQSSRWNKQGTSLEQIWTLAELPCFTESTQKRKNINLFIKNMNLLIYLDANYYLWATTALALFSIVQEVFLVFWKHFNNNSSFSLNFIFMSSSLEWV